jgi:hypothetical protein
MLRLLPTPSLTQFGIFLMLTTNLSSMNQQGLPPKNLWQKEETEIIAGAFSEDQIFGQGKDFAHDMCAYWKRERFKGNLQQTKTGRSLLLISPSRLPKTSLNLNTSQKQCWSK